MSILYGYHPVLSLLKQRPESIIQLSADPEHQNKRLTDLLVLAKKTQIPIQSVTKEKLTQIASCSEHQGIVAICKNTIIYHEADLENIIQTCASPPLFLVLDGIQDPQNLGACIRTAETAGVQALIIPKDNSAPVTPVVHKTACGATALVPIIVVTNLSRTLQKLKTLGIWLVGTVQKSETLIYKTDLTVPLAFILGNEAKGLRRLTKEQCDFLVKIPMQGTVESLNVSVATGICLFEAIRQRLG